MDLDGRAGRLVYQENLAGDPGFRGPSRSRCDLEKARQTILEQELTFRNQLQDLHRLYRRQKELMDELANNEERPRQSSFLASGDSMKEWNSLKFPSFLEGKVVQNYTRIMNSCKTRLSKNGVCMKGPYPYGLRIQADVPNGVDKPMQDRVLKFSSVDRDATKLSLSAVQTLDPCDGCAEKLKFDGCNSVGASSFPQLTRRPPKLFGVELGDKPFTPMDSNGKAENPQGELPWFLKNMQDTGNGNFRKSETLLHIDLNLSWDEEALPSTPLQTTTTTEVDDKIAAEALLSIASHRVNSVPANTSCLNWFAEIVSSQRGEEDNPIPGGIDQFEYMTLQLEESKEEQYHGYEAYVLRNHQREDEAKRPRRGASRRGRVRKDFQRDILPSMTTLSRLEVTEDFQVFEKLVDPEGGVRQPSFCWNGRGRKRSFATQQRRPVCHLRDRSLTGWGKRTRRLPRQRCSNDFLSFTVKC